MCFLKIIHFYTNQFTYKFLCVKKSYYVWNFSKMLNKYLIKFQFVVISWN